MRRQLLLVFYSLLALAAIPASAAWTYESFKMGIDEKIAKTASTRSLNSLSLDFPYQGKNFGRIVFRNHPESGFEMIVRIDKGQITCGVYSCGLKIKFDNEPSFETWFVPAESSDGTVVFAREVNQFEERILKAKRMKVEIRLFHSSPQVLEFDVTGLDPKKINRLPLSARAPEKPEAAAATTDEPRVSLPPVINSQYLEKITGRIKANRRLTNLARLQSLAEGAQENPEVEYRVELERDGSVKSIGLVRASGVSAFDDAVKRSIEQSAPFPPDPATGKVPESLIIMLNLLDKDTPSIKENVKVNAIPDPSNRAAEYPKVSQRLGEQGVATIRYVVKTDGSVDDVEVLHSSGFIRLDRAAADAVKTWRFKPATIDGKPTESAYQNTITFTNESSSVR
jgi:TonB family protein